MCKIWRVAGQEPFVEDFDRREKLTGYFKLIASIVVNLPQNGGQLVRNRMSGMEILFKERISG
jgi:hypothetical protein